MDVPKDYKICVERRSPQCVKAGPKTLKWKGRVCPKCYPYLKADYYQRHKKEINDKITMKRKQKRIAKLSTDSESK